MNPVNRSRPVRLLMAVPALGLALGLGACGGGSSGSGAAPSSDLPGTGTSAPPAAAGSPSASASTPGTASGHSMRSMTYPPVTPGPPAAGERNDTDVAFATDMIPHHGQAVQMADMILARTATPAVRSLAERIKAAQTPEIATMSGWLKGWGQALPDPYAHLAGMPGMDHGGMMSDQQLSQLGSATGTAADKLFLTQMQEHHQGAIDMAGTELAQGANPEAKRLARSISTSQAAEIAEMKKLLTTLG